MEAWAVTEFQDDSGRVCHWTLDLEFSGSFGNGSIHLPWARFAYLQEWCDSNRECDIVGGYSTHKQGAAQTSTQLLQDLSFFRMTCVILGMTWDMVGSILLDE